MKDFLVRIQAIPSKLANVVNGFLDGLGAQVATVKGAVFLTIASLFMLDIMAKGSIGIIQYCIEQSKELIEIIAKTGGWQLIVFALIALLWKKDAK